LYPLAGLVFGFWKGFFITLIGDALGATIAFYISRSFGLNILHYFMGRRSLPMLEKLMVRMGDKKTFIKARIFFVGVPELFAYAAGLTKVSFLVFFPVHVLIGAIPSGLLVAFGDLLVTGDLLIVASVTIFISLFTAAGVWWFYLDLSRSA